MTRALRAPFLIINTKAYLYGDALLQLATDADELSAEYGVDVLFTVQHADIRLITEGTERVVVCAQHMDPIRPGAGTGFILPESLKAAGADAVLLNHAAHPVTLADLDADLARAREVGLRSVVCADSISQCRAVAAMSPDVMICEPTTAIGTGSTSTDDYVRESTAAVRAVDPRIMVLQGAGISSGADVSRVLAMGADASGATTGIINSPDPRATVAEMLGAVRVEKDRRTGSGDSYFQLS